MSNWKPRPSDIEWARSMIRHLKQDGTWLVPMNASAYRFDHANKTLWLTDGPQDDLFDKTVATFGAIGWQVKVDDSQWHASKS